MKSSRARAIALMARAPSAPGKTRLTASLTDAQAGELRAALLLDTLDVARSLDIPVVIRYTPKEAHDEMAALAGEVPIASQSGRDLGARMFFAVIEGFAAGADTVVVLGSDLPTLPAPYVIDAFTALEGGADVVFGPAEDGGYYLVGMRWGAGDSVDRARRLRDVFVGIPWSTNRVLRASRAAAQAAGLTAVLIEPWYDVDVPENLTRVVTDPRADAAPRTRALSVRSHRESGT